MMAQNTEEPWKKTVRQELAFSILALGCWEDCSVAYLFSRSLARHFSGPAVDYVVQCLQEWGCGTIAERYESLRMDGQNKARPIAERLQAMRELDRPEISALWLREMSALAGEKLQLGSLPKLRLPDEEPPPRRREMSTVGDLNGLAVPGRPESDETDKFLQKVFSAGSFVLLGRLSSQLDRLLKKGSPSRARLAALMGVQRIPRGGRGNATKTRLLLFKALVHEGQSPLTNDFLRGIPLGQVRRLETVRDELTGGNGCGPARECPKLMRALEVLLRPIEAIEDLG